MRDFIILAIILGSVPFCFQRPFFGVLMWTWIAYFSPHRYAWSSTVYYFPVAMVVAIPTLLGMLFARKMNRNILTRESGLILADWLWMGVTLVVAAQVPLFAGHISDGINTLLQITKILVMTFVTMLLVNSKSRLRQLVLVMAFSLGMRAVWVSIFGIQTGGEFRVYGPHDTFLADNNDFALGLNMMLPLLYFMISGEKKKWIRYGLWLSFLGSIFSVILTYSRGGLLGLGVVLLMIAFMSRYRIVALAGIAAVVFMTLSFAPQQWTDRMDKAAHGDIDSSAEQRLIGWRTGWNMVMDYPITGGGLDAYPDVVVFRHYQPEEMPGGRASEGPHSIYFQVLGEQGFVGLALFVALLASCILSLHQLRRQAKRISRSHWIIPYTRMFEVSLAAFMVSGAFLGRAYFDLWYGVIACIVVLKILFRQELAQRKTQTASARSTFELQQELPVAAV